MSQLDSEGLEVKEDKAPRTVREEVAKTTLLPKDILNCVLEYSMSVLHLTGGGWSAPATRRQLRDMMW